MTLNLGPQREAQMGDLQAGPVKPYKSGAMEGRETGDTAENILEVGEGRGKKEVEGHLKRAKAKKRCKGSSHGELMMGPKDGLCQLSGDMLASLNCLGSPGLQLFWGAL